MLRRTAAPLFLLSAWCLATVPGAHGLSPEVEEVLAETHFRRPPSTAERETFLRRLQRRGVETITDLQPYLDGSEVVRANTLLAMEHLGGIDPGALDRIEELVRTATNSQASSVATAVRIVLNHAPHARAVAFGSSVAPQLHLASLHELMSWTSAQDIKWLKSSTDATILTTRCLQRLRSLFASGRYSGKWPLRFATTVEHAPFDDSAHVADVVDAFLAAIVNAGGFTDLESTALVSAFAVVASASRRAPNFVEARLTEIMATAALPVLHLILWRMSAEGLDGTAQGARIEAEALARSPDLVEFVGRLRGTNDWSSTAGDELKRDIRQAFAALAVPNPEAPASHTGPHSEPLPITGRP